MATEQGFKIHQVITELMQNNALHSVLLPEGDHLKAHTPATALQTISSEFIIGAGLDSRNLPENALFVALDGENVDGRNFVASPLEAGHWILTRNVNDDPDHPVDPLLNLKAVPGGGVLLCQDPENALALIAACWRKTLSVEIVAITGTNGKTTTKDLVRAMLSGAGKTQATAGNLNNHLGLPLTLLNLQEDTRYAVIEMGASAVGEIRFLAGLTVPQVGVITNASPAHLSEFGSLENIIEGKGELLEALPADGVAILNTDSPGFERWQKRAVCPVVSWGQEQGNHRWTWSPADENTEESLILDGTPWYVPLPGHHNAANLCAAVLACRALGVDDEILQRGLSSFQGSAHRGLVVHWSGRTVLDDSYNANPASMVAAVGALTAMPGSGRTVAVLGAMAELGPDSASIHEETGKKLMHEKLDFLLAVGETAFPLAAQDADHCQTFQLEDHEAAALWLMKNSKAGDRILIKGSRSSAMEKVLQILKNHEKTGKGNTE